MFKKDDKKNGKTNNKVDNKKNKSSNKKLTPEEALKQTKERTAQQWMPIADIDGQVVYRKDNNILAYIRIQPESIDLLSKNEKRNKVSSQAECYNGENESIQIFCVGRPVDLNDYLESLQERAKMEHNFTRKNVLKGYIQDASHMASSGDTIERRFYMIISKIIEDNKSINELIDRLNELKDKLTQADLMCNICTDDDILDLFSLFANPLQAAYEKNEIEYDLPPVVEY